MSPPVRPQPADPHDPQPDRIRLVTCLRCKAELGQIRNMGTITVVKINCRCGAGAGRDVLFNDHREPTP
jgi:hypothetical protein